MSGFGIQVEAADRLVDVVGARRVGARDDDEIGIEARIARRLHLLYHFFRRNHALARHVAAALGPHLVLEHDRRHARLLEGARREIDAHRVAVTGVGIRAQQQVGAVGEAPRIADVLFQPHHAAVRPAQAALRRAGSGDGARLETEVLGEARAVAVVDAGGNQDFGSIDELSELPPLAFAGHRIFSAQWMNWDELKNQELHFIPRRQRRASGVRVMD